MSQVTKRALEQALKHFLSLKPLNKVTISDLTDYCGINRMTFYYHFDDIYDLVSWCCEENIRRAWDKEDPQSTWQDGFRSIFQVALRDRDLVLNIYRVIGRDQAQKYIMPYIQRIITQIVDTGSASDTVSPEDRQFVADCYNYIFSGIILDWVQAGMSEEPERIVERTDTLLRGSCAHALARFSHKPS